MRAATALPTVPTRLLEQLSLDAGKTSLTERLLYEAGAIVAPGSVDDGTTRTDSMDIERRRGITVRTNVASFAVGDVQVNLIDTPGHSDFIAEVERSLSVLDAAVLVVSAVEGVQSQTVVLRRALRRLAVPTLIFVNKIDRAGADPGRVLGEIDRRLTAPGPGGAPRPRRGGRSGRARRSGRCGRCGRFRRAGRQRWRAGRQRRAGA